MFIMWAVLIVVIFASIIGGRLYYLSKETFGEEVSGENGNKSALLVLDVQNDTLSMKEYTQKDVLVKNINKAIEFAKENEIEIIYTKQVFTNPIDKFLSGGLYVENTEGSELSPEIEVISSHVYEKERTDAFSNTELEKYLLDQKITTVYIVGADASACVYKTALGGLNRNYQVIILEDCIFSISDKFLNEAIKKYENKGIQVSDLNEFLK